MFSYLQDLQNLVKPYQVNIFKLGFGWIGIFEKPISGWLDPNPNPKCIIMQDINSNTRILLITNKDFNLLSSKNNIYLNHLV